MAVRSTYVSSGEYFFPITATGFWATSESMFVVHSSTDCRLSKFVFGMGDFPFSVSRIYRHSLSLSTPSDSSLLLGQQIRNALYRMRGFVERGLAKGMTCRSPMAHAVRDLSAADSRGMSVVQAAVVGHFESHTITKFAWAPYSA